jgi:hypothetical protein
VTYDLSPLKGIEIEGVQATGYLFTYALDVCGVATGPNNVCSTKGWSPPPMVCQV